MEKRAYIISTDTCCDMELAYYRENNVNLMGLTYTIDGEEFVSASEKDLLVKDFYARVRGGALPKTAQVPVEQAIASFEAIAQKGFDIFHLAFSSGLSGTYQACVLAANEVMERYPGCTIRVVDSLAASMGQGLLLTHAIRLKNEGLSLAELTARIEEDRYHLVHNFTVDDLHHLHRGGRVSKLSAVVGTALGIKPALHVDDEGHLINVAKVRGRKQALTWLVDKMAERVGSWKNDVIYISHGDCEEDANFVADLVKKRFGIKAIKIGFVGPVIGSHAGPGTVALFFFGDTREI